MTTLAAVVSVLAFAAMAVWIRRRFDTEQLIAASVAGSMILGALIIVIGWNQTDFLFAPPLAAVIGGAIATAVAVEQLARRLSIPNRMVETVIGAFAFAAGGMVGFYVGFLFSLQGGAWVG